MSNLTEAFATVEKFASSTELSARTAKIESNLAGQSRDSALSYLEKEGIGEEGLLAALAIKAMSGQINVIVHTLGILVALPYVLHEGEVIESLSLGAGNTGRKHDLETDRQVAEFKFIDWRGGPESIRQNTLFADLFGLVCADTTKRKVLYVVGKEYPMRFLHGGRALSSVLSKNEAVAARFRKLHGETFSRVRDYYATVKGQVEIVDLREIVPALMSTVGFDG